MKTIAAAILLVGGASVALRAETVAPSNEITYQIVSIHGGWIDGEQTGAKEIVGIVLVGDSHGHMNRCRFKLYGDSPGGSCRRLPISVPTDADHVDSTKTPFSNKYSWSGVVGSDPSSSPFPFDTIARFDAQGKAVMLCYFDAQNLGDKDRLGGCAQARLEQ